VDHHAARCGQAVRKDDRRAVAEGLASDRDAGALDVELLRSGAGDRAQWTVIESIRTG
jgi:hypothetical protein